MKVFLLLGEDEDFSAKKKGTIRSRPVGENRGGEKGIHAWPVQSTNKLSRNNELVRTTEGKMFAKNASGSKTERSKRPGKKYSWKEQLERRQKKKRGKSKEKKIKIK